MIVSHSYPWDHMLVLVLSKGKDTVKILVLKLQEKLLCHPLLSFFLDPLWSQSSLASGGLFCLWTLRLTKECKFCFLQMQFYERKVKVKVTQSCLTLYDPMDCSQQGSSVHGIPQARILEWVAILFFKGSSKHRTWTQVSHIASRFFTIWSTREAQFYELSF